MRYKSKPAVIDAIQWTGCNPEEISGFTDGGFNYEIKTDRDGTQQFVAWAEVYDYLQETWVNVNLNDFIIKGTKGEFYPCDDEVFEAKYEPVESLGLYNPEFTKGNTP